MRTTLALLTTLLLTLALTATASAQGKCNTLEPGKGIDKLRFGMTKAEIGKLGLPVKPGFTENVLEVGPYTVYLDNEGIATVGLKAADITCLNLTDDKKTSRPSLSNIATTELEEFATWVGGCGLLQMNIGATVIDCTNGLSILQSMGGKEIRISRKPPAVDLVCDGYISPGAPDSTTNAIDVKPGKTYCVGTRTLTSEIHPPDITALDGVLRYNTCPRTDKRGGTIVSCDFDGVRFLFAGPKAELHRIEAVPLKK